jgi:zinc D-Ala-D-Ala carboxypeptidase
VYQSPRHSRFRTVPPPRVQRRMSRAGLLVMIAAAITVIVLVVFFLVHHRGRTTVNHTTTTTSSKPGVTQSAATQAPAGFNKAQYSTTDPASIWVVVNKQHQLGPKDYTPKNLVVPDIPLRSNITSTEKYVRSDMAKALETMVAAATGDGIHLNLQSGYRSYSFQVSLYNSYVKQQGQAAADRQSARAGYSEHQTGLAADLGGTSKPACNVDPCFADTVEGKWLAANAYKYGFIIRYTAAKETVTGYEYEPWHVRYIGNELALEMHNQSVETLEEFFNITGGPNY